MLSDTDTYRVLHVDPTETFRPLLKSLIDGEVSLGLIAQREADYMIPQHPFMSIFHSFRKDTQGGFSSSIPPYSCQYRLP